MNYSCVPGFGSRWRLVVFLAMLAALLGGCVTTSPPGPAEDRSVAIEDVIVQVQRALADTQDMLAARKFPPLKEVRLTLQTVASHKTGGSLKLWVLAAGASVERTATQQIVLSLVPPKAREIQGAAPALPDELEHAIRSAVEGVEKARTGPVPLVTNSLDVEINFVVKRSADGGLSLAVAPVSAGLDGGVGAAVTQTVKVSFAGR
ncbi:MAG TPA: trypco2 family protein [Candidatus Didemnitutus sp.]|nr:trypco2 family protein [Candidatus Didemnitutus sp.]